MGKIKLKDRLSRWLRPAGSTPPRKAQDIVEGPQDHSQGDVTYVTDSAETLSSPSGTK